MAHQPDADLEKTLEALAPADPPADLTPSIMEEVSKSASRLSAWQKWRRAGRARQVTNFSTTHRVDTHVQGRGAVPKGVVMGKKLLWSVAGVAAVLVVSLLVFGYPPVGPGTEGTSGGAQRYVGKQLSAKDVKVADTDVQRFIQSDTFDRLIKNDVTRKALVKAFSEPEVANALRNKHLIMALQDEEVREVLANPVTAQAMTNAEFRKLFSDLELAKTLAGEDEIFASLATLELQRAIKNKHLLDALELTDVEEILANEAFAKVLKNPLIAEAFADERAADLFAELGKSFKNKAVITALEDSNLELALEDPVVLAALAKGPGIKGGGFREDAEMAAALAKYPSLKGAFSDMAFFMALADDDLRQAFEDDGVRAAMLDADFIVAMQDDQIIEAMHHPAFAMMMADDELMQAFSRPGVMAAVAEPEILQAFTNPAFAKFMAEHGDLIASLANLGFADVLSDASFVEAMGDLSLAGAFSDNDVIAALSNVEFAMELSKADGLGKALADMELRGKLFSEMAGKK